MRNERRRPTDDELQKAQQDVELGTQGIADREEFKKNLKKAFRQAAQKHHPDKGGDAEKFKAAKQAEELLRENPTAAAEFAQRKINARKKAEEAAASADEPTIIHERPSPNAETRVYQAAEEEKSESIDIDSLPLFFVKDQVSVVRTGGQIEPGWTVTKINYDSGYYKVVKATENGILKKDIPFDEVEEVTPEPKHRFETSWSVIVPRSDGSIDMQGWFVKEILENGDYVVRNPETGIKKAVEKQTLERAQHLAYMNQ